MEETPIKPHSAAAPEKGPAAAQSGFSLIEVLVAIVVLSLGMLGAVGMQTTAMQSNREARSQAVATTFSRELAEKMRGNHAIAIQTTASNNPYRFDTTLTGTSSVATFTRQLLYYDHRVFRNRGSGMGRIRLAGAGSGGAAHAKGQSMLRQKPI